MNNDISITIIVRLYLAVRDERTRVPFRMVQLVEDTHVISSLHITEESLKDMAANQRCEFLTHNRDIPVHELVSKVKIIAEREY